MRRPYFLLSLPLLLLTACPSRATNSSSPPDARAPVVIRDNGPATHICYGPGGSAVEVDPSTSCASLGGSETPPMEVPNAPVVRRDGGTPSP